MLSNSISNSQLYQRLTNWNIEFNVIGLVNVRILFCFVWLFLVFSFFFSFLFYFIFLQLLRPWPHFICCILAHPECPIRTNTSCLGSLVFDTSTLWVNAGIKRHTGQKTCTGLLSMRLMKFCHYPIGELMNKIYRHQVDGDWSCMVCTQRILWGSFSMISSSSNQQELYFPVRRLLGLLGLLFLYA